MPSKCRYSLPRHSTSHNQASDQLSAPARLGGQSPAAGPAHARQPPLPVQSARFLTCTRLESLALADQHRGRVPLSSPICDKCSWRPRDQSSHGCWRVRPTTAGVSDRQQRALRRTACRRRPAARQTSGGSIPWGSRPARKAPCWATGTGSWCKWAGRGPGTPSCPAPPPARPRRAHAQRAGRVRRRQVRAGCHPWHRTPQAGQHRHRQPGWAGAAQGPSPMQRPMQPMRSKCASLLPKQATPAAISKHAQAPGQH